MARVKPQNLHPIHNLDEANEALQEIGELKRIQKDIELQMNDDIAKIKAGAEQDAASYMARCTALENGLMAFADANKLELFKDKRSVDLNYGSIGYRKSTELGTLKGCTWKTVLGKLKELAFKEAIRIKEEPDREIMSQWPDERLELVGIQRREKDTFWLEINEEELAKLP